MAPFSSSDVYINPWYKTIKYMLPGGTPDGAPATMKQRAEVSLSAPPPQSRGPVQTSRPWSRFKRIFREYKPATFVESEKNKQKKFEIMRFGK